MTTSPPLHRLRRLSAVALGVVALTASAGAAQADPIFPEPSPSKPAPAPVEPTLRSCSATVPSRVAVASRRATMSVALSGDCPTGAWAAWDVVDPAGRVVQRVTFPAASARTVPLARVGTYTLRPVTAHDSGDRALLQNRPSVVVGARSRTVTASTRTGAVVRVTATASAYSAASGAYAPRAGARVVLQRSACASGCGWSTAATAVTGRTGTATLTATSASPAVWRTVVAGTPTIWGSVSGAFTR